MSTQISSKPPRWRWPLLGLLIVGALSVPTAIVYLQYRLQARPTDTARPWDDPILAQKLSDARLAKAKAIRAEWQTWALAHKTELSAMLASQGKDFAKAQAVYKISPPLTTKAWRPDTRSGLAKFAWYTDLEKMKSLGEQIQFADSESKRIFEAHKGSGEQKLKKEFGEKSDFTVASSASPGPTTTQIWASGRITERTWIHNPDRSRGKRSQIQLPYKELVPPFDFLTSANSG